MRKYLFFFLLIILSICTSSFHKPKYETGIYLIVDKSKYEMREYDADDNWLVTYPCVFGSDDQSDKMTEGDRRTPEGIYHVILKKVHPKWDKYLGLDYPNAEDITKFNDRKARGLIPTNARIGGDIGIHGTWPKQDFVVDYLQNWTNGCVCTKNEYIDEIFKNVPVGTKVIIKR